MSSLRGGSTPPFTSGSPVPGQHLSLQNICRAKKLTLLTEARVLSACLMLDIVLCASEAAMDWGGVGGGHSPGCEWGQVGNKEVSSRQKHVTIIRVMKQNVGAR